MYQQAFTDYKKALGPKHTSTLNAVNNLGNIYLKQGKLAETEQIYQRTLTDKKKTLDTEHTLTLNIVHNLGNLYQA